MRMDQIIIENQNMNVVSIDFQPAYLKYHIKELARYVQFLNQHNGEVTYFYNSEEYSNDTIFEIQDMLLDYGLNEDKLYSIKFIEKTYGFFRDFLDAGYEHSRIIKMIRYMIVNRINDTYDVSEQILDEIFGEDVSGLTAYIPDIVISNLKKSSPFYLCGGASDQCLLEFQILCNAMNIKYKLMKNMIY